MATPATLPAAMRSAAQAGFVCTATGIAAAAHRVPRGPATAAVVLVAERPGEAGRLRARGHRVEVVAADGDPGELGWLHAGGFDACAAATVAAVRAAAPHGPVVLVGSGRAGATVNRVANAVPYLLAHLVYAAAVCPVRREPVAAQPNAALDPARWGQVRHTYLRHPRDREVPLAQQDRFIADADAATPCNPFTVHDLPATSLTEVVDRIAARYALR